MTTDPRALARPDALIVDDLTVECVVARNTIRDQIAAARNQVARWEPDDPTPFCPRCNLAHPAVACTRRHDGPGTI